MQCSVFIYQDSCNRKGNTTKDQVEFQNICTGSTEGVRLYFNSCLHEGIETRREDLLQEKVLHLLKTFPALGKTSTVLRVQQLGHEQQEGEHH